MESSPPTGALSTQKANPSPQMQNGCLECLYPAAGYGSLAPQSEERPNDGVEVGFTCVLAPRSLISRASAP